MDYRFQIPAMLRFSVEADSPEQALEIAADVVNVCPTEMAAEWPYSPAHEAAGGDMAAVFYLTGAESEIEIIGPLDPVGTTTSEEPVRFSIRVVIIGNGHTGAAFYPCVVVCTEEQYSNGKHYDTAMGYISASECIDVKIAIDERDGEAWIIQHFSDEEWAKLPKQLCKETT